MTTGAVRVNNGNMDLLSSIRQSLLPLVAMSTKLHERNHDATIHVITLERLVEHFGGTARFWSRRRRAMAEAGLLNKVGRQFFGDLERIARALSDGSFPETAIGKGGTDAE